MSGIPLYMDTIFTISVTLVCGFFFGAVCGAVTNFLHHTVWGWGMEGYLFILCNIATALVTWFFMRIFPRELDLIPRSLRITIPSQGGKAAPPQSVNSGRSGLKISIFAAVMDRMVVLIIFSFVLCIVMSFLGGFIAAVIFTLSSSYNFEGSGIKALFSATMFGGNTPVIVSEIISRIPVNLVDRLVSVFCGYGIALCISRLYKYFASICFEKASLKFFLL